MSSACPGPLSQMFFALGWLLLAARLVGAAGGPAAPIPAHDRFADVRYVATGGSDENPGTAERPWATVQHAVDRAEPGATIRVGPGAFREQVAVRRSGKAEAPITIEGALDADGGRLTRISPCELVDPESWRPAPEVGPNVFSNDALPFEPYLLAINGGEVAHVHRNKPVTFSRRYVIGAELQEDPPWANLAMETLALPEDQQIPRRDGSSISLWETLGAIYAHHPDEDAGVTYLRMAGGGDPRQHEITVSPAGAVVTLADAGHVRLKNLELVGGDVGVLIRGERAVHNLVENCAIIHGRSRVHITDGASGAVIRGNYMAMRPYFQTRPGAWGGPDYGPVHARREYLYNFFKQLHGRGTSSDDCSVRIDGNASDIVVEDNHLDGGLIGIRFMRANGLRIRGNRIENHSSLAILFTDNVADVRVEGNRLHDNNINLRFQRLNFGDEREIYVYRNRLSQPGLVGTHIFCHSMSDRGDHPDVQATFYHNTFVGGQRVFNLPNPRRMPRSVPGFRFFNNVFASRSRAYSAREQQAQNTDAVGPFDYNWIGGEFPQGVPVWFGENNILAEGEHPWPPEAGITFELPPGHPARNAGIDLSRPFAAGGRDFDPLPGMAPGYYDGERPDMGAVQHRR